ncbi:MAG TPA: ATP-binding protein [Verrucomicrobiae bacterium]|nr:ATP-binding protein [Verrucomicrobiae bacterium]
MTSPETEPIAPREPESLEQTGLPESLLEQLIFKILYFRGDMYGQDLSAAIGLKFSVIDELIELLKLRHHIQIKKSLGMGSVGSVLALTEAGRERAREYLDANQYSGPAPVPVAQYREMVLKQRPLQGWLTKESLARAFRGMVVTERTLALVGPAISSSNSLLLYGKPGDGKTYLVESLNHLDRPPIYLPYSIECQGNIIQVFDPIYHHAIEEDRPALTPIAMDRSNFDRRWVRVHRPFIVTGGELTMDMLDLQYNQASKVYEAPFQLKANNGTYLIDDFGRQRATPAEVLNRWIVPMERRNDYLSFLTGGKMSVPFETFLVFSTNLKPSDLGDEAFLRRIQYKILLRGPAENEFVKIFENFCASQNLTCTREMVARFIDRHYRRTTKSFRRCHPRDVLSHALNLVHFEKLPLTLTDDLLDRAFESCFLQEQIEGHVEEAALLPVSVQTCADYWDERLTRIPTLFGGLAFAAGYRDRQSGKYVDPETSQRYGDAETHKVLSRLHARAFSEWLGMTAAQQVRDLGLFIASKEANGLRLSNDSSALANALAPEGARPEDVQRFAECLNAACAPAVERIA